MFVCPVMILIVHSNHNLICLSFGLIPAQQRHQQHKTFPLSCQSCIKNLYSFQVFTIFKTKKKKWAKILLYSNENINIRLPSFTKSVTLSISFKYLKSSRHIYESSGLLSPVQDNIGKSERCHTPSLVISQDGRL